MKYPNFFDKIEPIVMRDPLADFLGACEEGIIEYSYVDAVKFAGHSCPTVAGAYLMTKLALEKLYKNETPVRGEIKVDVKGALDEGVEGVIGNCAAFITGAANEGGFKGIGNKFGRNNKLHFQVDIDGDLRFTRIDTGKSVTLSYNPSSVPADPKQAFYMQKIMQKTATKEDRENFKKLWQQRVEKILTNKEIWKDIIKIKE